MLTLIDANHSLISRAMPSTFSCARIIFASALSIHGSEFGRGISTPPTRYDFLREAIQVVIGGELIDIHPMQLFPNRLLAGGINLYGGHRRIARRRRFVHVECEAGALLVYSSRRIIRPDGQNIRIALLIRLIPEG